MPGPLPRIDAARRIVVKLGSALVADPQGGRARRDRIDALAADIAALHAQGKDMILVSSGAVALGRPLLGLGNDALDLADKQAAAAAGQPLLMQAWIDGFAPHGIAAAQLLLTLDDSERRPRYLNARTTIERLLARRLIPVVNENDTVATAELKFGDNDRLAARVAVMASADQLILFSDVDGLYAADPRLGPAAFVDRVDALTPEVLAMAGAAASGVSTGGMRTKLDAARMALAAGCHMAIAQGDRPHALAALAEGARATWFVARTAPRDARRHWIATAMETRGGVVIDPGAEVALQRNASLLPAGVTAVTGGFERGDTIAISTQAGALIGRGIVGYSDAETRRIMGRRTDAIEDILGYAGRETLIHRDDLALL